jgi:hypothetical protein
METLLIFLAIIAIQMTAAYFKQKKEAAKKAAGHPIPMNLPQEEEYEEYAEYAEPEEKYEKPVEPEFSNEGIPPQKDIPFVSITSRKREPAISQLEPKSAPRSSIGDPMNGIIWIAILQEPRYKVKWKRR